MTKLRNISWEADRLYRSSVTSVVKTPSHPIIITGYLIKLAMIPSDPPWVGSNASSQVLWHMRIDPSPPGDDWGAQVLTDATGNKQNLHGSDGGPNFLALDILKASPWTSAVNDVLEKEGWELLVPANSSIIQFAGHAGQGPVDIEIQGVISYTPRA